MALMKEHTKCEGVAEDADIFSVPTWSVCYMQLLHSFVFLLLSTRLVVAQGRAYIYRSVQLWKSLTTKVFLRSFNLFLLLIS